MAGVSFTNAPPPNLKKVMVEFLDIPGVGTIRADAYTQNGKWMYPSGAGQAIDAGLFATGRSHTEEQWVQNDEFYAKTPQEQQSAWDIFNSKVASSPQEPDSQPITTNQKTSMPSNLDLIQEQINQIAKGISGLNTNMQSSGYAGIPNAGVTSGSVKLPTASKYESNISSAMGATSEMKAWTDFMAKQADEWKAQQNELMKQQATDKQTIWNKISGLGSNVTAKREEIFNQTYGGPPAEFIASQKARIAELDTLAKAYNAKEAEKIQILEKSGQRLAPMSFIRGEQALVERQYNNVLSTMSGDINAKTAVMQMEQGNYDRAMQYVNQAVEDYTWGLKTEVEMLTNFYNDNQQTIQNLDTKYQNALTNMMQLKQQELETQRDEYWKKLNYDLQVRQENRISNSGGGSSVTPASPGFNSSKVETDFRQDIVALKDQISVGTLTKEQAYSRLRDLYSPSEVSDQTIKDMLGILKPATFSQATGYQSPFDKAVYNALFK